MLLIERHELVETLIKAYFERQELREKLKEVYDLERLLDECFWKCECTRSHTIKKFSSTNTCYSSNR